MKCSWLGENAIEVSDLSNRIDDQIALKTYLETRLKNVEDYLFASTALVVVFKQSVQISLDHLGEILQNFEIDKFQNEVVSNHPVFEIPVCYEPDFALDDQELTERLSMSWEQIISIHQTQPLKVSMFGFMPGFSYLESIDEKIQLPRKSSPRVRVPKGSVAIANHMCGVYPNDGPGGWHIIGRTPMSFFDLSKEEPFRLSVGQDIRFKSISRREFEKFKDD